MPFPITTVSYHEKCIICNKRIELGGSGWLKINQDLEQDKIGDNCSWHRKHPNSEDYSKCTHLECDSKMNIDDSLISK